jgi:hypothetical protein
MIMARLRVVELPGTDGRYLLVIDKVQRLSPLHDVNLPKEGLPGGCAGVLMLEEVLEVE